MKVIVAALYATVESSFGNDLEIIQNHLDKGDHVSKLTCDHSLKACDRNRFHDISVCKDCSLRSEIGVKLLKNKENFSELSITQTISFAKQEMLDFERACSSIENLKQWKIDNFDIGYAILSSLVSWRLEHNPDLKCDENRKFLLSLSESSLFLYRECKRIFKKEEADIVYVFNGRYAPLRAIVRACEILNIEYFTHDRGGFDNHHYRLFKNSLPHGLKFFSNERDENWKNVSHKDGVSVAQNWFEKKARGFQGGWKDFTQNQKINKLPANWNDNQKNITIFTSSEREFSAIGEEWTSYRLFDSQYEGIRAIISNLSEDIGKHRTRLFIRIHPNQIPERNEIARINGLSRIGVDVLFPDSDISTYALINESDVAITFGSTVGIEAVYWGTPSILMGQCFYRDLNATYNPTSILELFDLLKKDKLEPKPKELSYPHAYRWATFGEAYKYYKSQGLFSGTFHGESMTPKKKEGLLKKIQNKVISTIQNNTRL